MTIGPYHARSQVNAELFKKLDETRDQFTSNHQAYRYRRRFSLPQKILHNAGFFLLKSEHPTTLRYVAAGRFAKKYLCNQLNKKIGVQEKRFNSNSQLAQRYLDSYSLSQRINISARDIAENYGEDTCRYVAAKNVIRKNKLHTERARFEENPQLAKRYKRFLLANQVKLFSEVTFNQRGTVMYRISALDDLGYLDSVRDD